MLIDKEEDLYTAHYLEFDIVADGKTIDQAKKEILSAIVNHVSFCIAVDNVENILNPAPKEYWQKFYFQESTRLNYPITCHSENQEYSIGMLKAIQRRFSLPDDFLY